MTKGIELVFTGAELVTHCKSRASYHATRAELYAKRVKDLKALGPLDVEAPNAFETTEYSNAKQALSNAGSRLEQHRTLARRFEVMSTHLANETSFALSLNDIATLELTD